MKAYSLGLEPFDAKKRSRLPMLKVTVWYGAVGNSEALMGLLNGIGVVEMENIRIVVN